MLPGCSRFLKSAPIRISGARVGGRRPFSYLRADDFLLPNIASDFIQRFVPYLAFVMEHI